MYNPYEDFNAKDEPLSDDIKNQLLQKKAQSERTVMNMQAAEQAAKQSTATATGTSGTQQPAQTQKEPQKEEPTNLVQDIAHYLLHRKNRLYCLVLYCPHP